MPVIQFNLVSDHVGAGSTDSITLTGVTSGNFIVVLVLASGATVDSSISDTLGTSYGSPVTSGSSGTPNAKVWIGTLTASGTCTVSCSTAGFAGNFEIGIWEIQSATTVALDSATTNTTLQLGPPAVTTTAANDLILLFAANQNGSTSYTATAPTVKDQTANNNAAAAIGNLPATSAGTYTPSLVNGQTSGWELDFTLALFASGTGPIAQPGVTQDLIEVAEFRDQSHNPSPIRITQAVVEYGNQPANKILDTQDVIEVSIFPLNHLIMTQVLIEVAFKPRTTVKARYQRIVTKRI